MRGRGVCALRGAPLQDRPKDVCLPERPEWGRPPARGPLRDGVLGLCQLPVGGASCGREEASGRLEPPRLPLRPDCPGERGPRERDPDPPLRPWAAEGAVADPRGAGCGGPGRPLPGALLAPDRGGGWRGPQPGLPGAGLPAGLGQLHHQRLLPALHVPVPAAVHPDLLRGAGPQRPPALRDRAGPGRGAAGVPEWHAGQRLPAALPGGELLGYHLLLAAPGPAGGLGPGLPGPGGLAAPQRHRPGEEELLQGQRGDGGVLSAAGRQHACPWQRGRGGGPCQAPSPHLLDGAERLPAGAAGSLQRPDQRGPALGADLLLPAVRGQRLPPLRGAQQHCQPRGLLCGHVPAVQVLPGSGHHLGSRVCVWSLPDGAGSLQPLPPVRGQPRGSGPGGRLLDPVPGPLLLREGGDWQPAARGRPQCPGLVWRCHPGRLASGCPRHVPPHHPLQRLPQRGGLCGQLWGVSPARAGSPSARAPSRRRGRPSPASLQQPTSRPCQLSEAAPDVQREARLLQPRSCLLPLFARLGGGGSACPRGHFCPLVHDLLADEGLPPPHPAPATPLLGGGSRHSVGHSFQGRARAPAHSFSRPLQGWVSRLRGRHRPDGTHSHVCLLP